MRTGAVDVQKGNIKVVHMTCVLYFKSSKPTQQIYVRKVLKLQPIFLLDSQSPLISLYGKEPFRHSHSAINNLFNILQKK